MDSLATSVDMLHLIDPTFSSITLTSSTTIDEAAKIPTVEMEASTDPSVTYLSDALRVLSDGGVPCCKDKAAFTVVVSEEIQSLSSDELASRLADIRMAERRTCTSFATRHDESTACCGDRFEQMIAKLDQKTCGKACEMIAARFNELKASYTLDQWDRMLEERIKYLDRLDVNSKSRKFKPFQSWDRHGLAISRTRTTLPDWCCMQDERDAWKEYDDKINKLLSIAATSPTAPPTSIGMGRPVPLTGLEILTRLHVVLGHPPIDQMLATLAKTQNMRSNVVTKSDVEAFVKQGCIQCIMWKMRRSPVKSLTDATRAPVGKKWSYDTLTLKVKTTNGNHYITRFLDDGSGKKRSYGHADFTAETLAKILAVHRAWVRPTHGEIWVGRRDGHPSQRAKTFQDALTDAQMHDETTAPYRHEAMPVEITWQHDVPGSMILLSTGPGAKLLRHFEAAFLCHEDASNRIVKPRAHDGNAVSANMLYYGDETAHANLLYAFWSPVMYLIYPEIRANKFSEHAHPGAYYGPSRDTESDRYCLVWNGHRSFTVDKGCIRIDERQVIAMSSRTNKVAQPFTLSPDAPVQLRSVARSGDTEAREPANHA